MIIKWMTTKARQFLPVQDAGFDELNVSFDFALSPEIMNLLFVQNDDCTDAGGRATHGAVADDCTDAGGTTPWMGEVEQRMEQLPRATHGAIAETGRQAENANAVTQFALDEYELALA